MNTFGIATRAPRLTSTLLFLFCLIASLHVLIILNQPAAEDDDRFFVASNSKIQGIAPAPITVDSPSIQYGIKSSAGKHLLLHSIVNGINGFNDSIISWKATSIATAMETELRINLMARTRTRVACIIPYIGRSLPSWFDSFAFAAYSSASIFDFLIFVTEVPQRELPQNVKIIRIEKNDLYERLVKLDTNELVNGSYDDTFNSVKELIENYPYVLVEFKPCLGVIFSDYLKEYSHWALADLDLLIGNMHEIITPEILNQHDIYTSSFGDSNRMYLRGQLTIHKNQPNINNLWRDCDHLSHLSARLKYFSMNHQWQFQSAEGCYSSVAGKSVYGK